MKLEKINIPLFGQNTNALIQKFEKSDCTLLKEIWDLWYKLSESLKKYSQGEARKINLPEFFSEGCWCLFSGSVRVLKPSSADTYNINNKKAEQIKASIVSEDLTSFGPKSKWDDLYFLDFSRLDGSFDVYEIPNDILINHIANKGKNETFEDQQNQRRRPRLSIKKKLIKTYGIKPIYKNVKLW